MRSLLSFFLAFFIFTTVAFAQTYTVGETEYYSNQTYSTSGLPKVKRSAANKKAFLESRGYTKTPAGYQVDHIIPLSKGGTDSPYNMQLLSVDQHKAKTARERSTTTTGIPTFSTPTSTYKVPSYNSASYKLPKMPSYSAPSYSVPSYNSSKVIQTGSRGGKYYINSNGNKTYVKD
ncbi:HNH endonuclease [Salegentibacter sp. LM13S]|uniref:HNH endonuclease n=1 Tax=Salegentibacter lacus TaxID=2873599 RepID=UPI001CCD6B7B|nr:HNH endonuclease signature motif containing protein [Salegentibacter lacus]MBZ9631245.1 HNH endonuclease [Salegentibacter lacus]